MYLDESCTVPFEVLHYVKDFAESSTSIATIRYAIEELPYNSIWQLKSFAFAQAGTYYAGLPRMHVYTSTRTYTVLVSLISACTHAMIVLSVASWLGQRYHLQLCRRLRSSRISGAPGYASMGLVTPTLCVRSPTPYRSYCPRTNVARPIQLSGGTSRWTAGSGRLCLRSRSTASETIGSPARSNSTDLYGPADYAPWKAATSTAAAWPIPGTMVSKRTRLC